MKKAAPRALHSDYAACLDFSVSKGGFLKGFPMSGEEKLSQRSFVYEAATQGPVDIMDYR
jgi:hypothetical protein